MKKVDLLTKIIIREIILNLIAKTIIPCISEFDWKEHKNEIIEQIVAMYLVLEDEMK